MRSHLRRIGLAAGASAATAVTLHVLGLSPWSGGQGAAFPELVSIASLVGACALFDLPAPRSDRGAVLRLSFVAEFAVLILFGPTAMTIVAGFGSLNRMLNGPLRRDRLRDGVVDVLAVVAASQAAGLSLEQIRTMLAPDGRPRVDRHLLARKADEIDATVKRLRAVSRGLRHAAVCPAPNHAECPTFQRLLRAAATGALDAEGKKVTLKR